MTVRHPTLRLAVGQAESDADPMKVAHRAAALVADAGRAGARVLLLSELHLFGYDVTAISEDADRTVDVTDARLRPIVAACVAGGVDCLVGAAIRTPWSDRPGNGLLRIAADGTVTDVYRKTHLWESERAVFEPGHSASLLEVDGIRIGVGICYDAGFPEYVRALAVAGADVVLFSSAFARGDEERRYDIYHVARALESGVWVAVANALGATGESDFFGRGAIIDPRGRPVAALGSVSGIVVHDLDRPSVEDARRALPYLVDRAESYPVERH